MNSLFAWLCDGGSKQMRFYFSILFIFLFQTFNSNSVAAAEKAALAEARARMTEERDKRKAGFCTTHPYETEVGLYVVATALVCLLAATAFPIILSCDGSCKRRARKDRMDWNREGGRRLRPHREAEIEMGEVSEVSEVKKKPRRTVRFSEVAEALAEDQKKKERQAEAAKEVNPAEVIETKMNKTAEEVPVGAVAPFQE